MQYHNYIFFDLRPSAKISEKAKKAFAALIDKNKKVVTYGYSTLGLKADARFMLWFQSDALENIQELLNKLLKSELGKYLKITHTLFGLTRPSQYSNRKHPASEEQKISGTVRGKYLIVYPFTKTTEWHLLPQDTRQQIMIAHMKVGHGFAPIKQQLLYAYGVDDHEFIVSYETESLADFQSLVMAMRTTESRRYTKNDLPIFTCVYQPLKKVLDVV